MYKYSKFRQIGATIAGMFGTNRAARQLNCDRVRYHGSRIFKIYPEKELDDLKHNLVCLHYSDYMKPWGEKGKRPVFSKYWWDVARTTGLFDGQE